MSSLMMEITAQLYFYRVWWIDPPDESDPQDKHRWMSHRDFYAEDYNGDPDVWINEIAHFNNRMERMVNVENGSYGGRVILLKISRDDPKNQVVMNDSKNKIVKNYPLKEDLYATKGNY